VAALRRTGGEPGCCVSVGVSVVFTVESELILIDAQIEENRGLGKLLSAPTYYRLY
jgi:hypothetical protein